MNAESLQTFEVLMMGMSMGQSFALILVFGKVERLEERIKSMLENKTSDSK